ncbi:OSTA/TMEM184 family protein [Rhodotorula paludigena]|uniref:OSTA/TMEM184 family protein n=1 Tax=Rhodotorula paludigena TaxID=86838 RepID=UPI0031731FBF
MRVCIGQYVIVRPVSTFASVLGEATGYYCLASWSPKFVHVWSAAAITISVTVAMYCVLQLYWPLRGPLKPYKPVLKFLCIKLVVFLTFWQEASLHFLITLGWIKDSEYWTAEEIVVGLAALLSCAEMVLFSFLHVRAFTYLTYRALAPPVAFDADGIPLTPDLPGLTSGPDLAPAAASEWSALPDLPSAPRVRPHPSLASPKLAKDFDASLGFAPTKADGLPLLHRTRRWPALKTADDLEKVMGAARPSAGKPDSRNGEDDSGREWRDAEIGSVAKDMERPGQHQTRQREGRGERIDPLRPIGGTFEQLPRACQSMQPAHRYVHSETTVRLLGELSAPSRQDPAWTMAAPASRKSQGLPPGAAAPFS